MKKYDINKMLDEWSTGGTISTDDPFPSPDQPDGVEDLSAGDKESGLTTNIPGPTDPKNIPGPDRTKVVDESSLEKIFGKSNPTPSEKRMFAHIKANKDRTEKQRKNATEKALKDYREKYLQKKSIKEAEGDVMSTTSQAPQPTNTPAQPPKEQPMTTPDMQMDPSMGSDPSMGAMAGGDMGAQDPSMMGMGMPTGPASTFEVGRIYELKKIYSRLVSMQSYLAGTTDPNLIKLRNYVSNSMDLFRTLISNIALYKDRLDEIIVVFYKVVDNVYVILSKYYKDKDSGKMVQAVE